MLHEESILVSLTSWKKRITNVKTVIESILAQTLTPNKILINLCTEDFPNMEEDLPDDLLDIIRNNDNIELYWYIENYKAWKKHLRVLEIADDNTLIVSIDDDHIYPNDFIEKMYVSYCYYRKLYPVTMNNIQLCHNLWCFNGAGMLYRKRDFGNYKKYLTYDILHNCWEDIFITLLFAINNVMILPVLFELPKDKDMLFNDNDAFSDHLQHLNNDYYQSMRESTFKAINDSLEANYFKGKESVFYPKFWEIVHNLINNIKNNVIIIPPAMQFVFDNYETNFLKANIPVEDKRKINLEVPRSSNKADLVGDNKIIVTVSSWPPRIKNVAPVLHNIIYGTITPDKIVVNLAKTDFGFNIEDDVTIDMLENTCQDAKELCELAKQFNDIIEFHWYDDAALRSWKKHIYAIHHFNSDDVIICIDDDVIYTYTFVEVMTKSYNYYGRQFPITCCIQNFSQGCLAFHGTATLYRPKDFANFDKYTSDTILHMIPEDNHLSIILTLNHSLLMPVIGDFYIFNVLAFNETEANFGNSVFDEKWRASLRELLNESQNIVNNTCADAPEIQYNWNPVYYNFSYETIRLYLENYKDIHNQGLRLKVYNVFDNYLHSSFGSFGYTGLGQYISTVIL